jgi:hypothetical protein
MSHFPLDVYMPWVVVTDNMKTAVLGRDEHHQPIWNPAYQKLAVEFKFHPDVCPGFWEPESSGVEPGEICEGNFLAGRSL